jgi:cytidylate kinase
MAVITISRQFGAGGKTLGKAVAQKLGYAFVDEDIIQMVADRAKVSKHWVESIEKEAGGRLLKFMSSLVSRAMVDRILGGERGYIDEEIYVNILHEVIRQVAHEGNVIILGRGGQYILKDLPDAFHLLLVAEKKDRIGFMEKHYNLSASEAERVVDVQGKRRMNLYRKFGKEDYDQPLHYHLVVNRSRMDLDRAVNLISKTVTSWMRNR